MATKKQANQPKNIGVAVKKPEQATDDSHCPFYGKLKVRGRRFTGTVTSDKMQRTATVQWTRQRLVPKYERYEQRITKIHAHNPDSIAAKKGDKVVVVETKPISKTKHFVIVEKLGQDIDYQIKAQSIEADAAVAKGKTQREKPAQEQPAAASKAAEAVSTTKEDN